MAQLRSVVLLVASVFITFPASAGGSFESVRVQSLKMTGNTDYDLVVEPITRSGAEEFKDPYMGNCTTFTVKGTFSRVHAAFLFPSFVTRESHIAALSHLNKALASNRPVNLGWVGTGFVAIDPTAPCVVRSRALHLNVERGETAVLSLHNAL